MRRRRAGLTLLQVAKKLKLSKHWVNKMELGEIPCVTLMGYWNDRN